MTDTAQLDALAQAISDAETADGRVWPEDVCLGAARVMFAADWRPGGVTQTRSFRNEAKATCAAYAAGRAFRNAQITSPLEDKIEGLQADLDAALDIIQRRGDAEAREWLNLNYPRRAAQKGGA